MRPSKPALSRPIIVILKDEEYHAHSLHSVVVNTPSSVVIGGGYTTATTTTTSQKMVNNAPSNDDVASLALNDDGPTAEKTSTHRGPHSTTTTTTTTTTAPLEVVISSSSPPLSSSAPPVPYEALFPSMPIMTPLEVPAYSYPTSHDDAIDDLPSYSHYDVSFGSWVSQVDDVVPGPDRRSPDSLSLSSSFGLELNATGRNHHQEREVSSMGGRSGSTGRSRSGLRLAKKERRQKAKDGNEGVDAFAGDDESCEDEGMTEIVVVSPQHPHHDKSDSNWASNMLEPPSALIKPQTSTSIDESVGIVETTTTTTTTTAPMRHADLRRGKRALMRSWLDTPALGVTEADLPSDGAINITNSSPSPSKSILPQAIASSYIAFSMPGIGGREELQEELQEEISMELLSPSYGAEPSISLARPGSISLSGVHPSMGSGAQLLLSPVTSMSLVGENEGAGSSSMSVRHSRPRDTIRSIQAMRNNEVSPPQVLHRISSPTRSRSPVMLMSSSSSMFPTNYLSRNLSRQTSISKTSYGTQNFSLEVTPVSSGLTEEVNAGDKSAGNVSLQLSLHPGPKPRNVVTFNADAYNLDTWDADVMGLFALPTEGVPAGALGRDNSSAKFGNNSSSSDPRSWGSHPRRMFSDECEASPQTSFSVLTAYFDNPRNYGADAPLSDVPIEQQCSFGEGRRQVVSNEQDVDDGEGHERLSVGAVETGRTQEIHTSCSSAVQYVVSPLEVGALTERNISSSSRRSSSAMLSPKNISSSIISPSRSPANEHRKYKDHLLQIAVKHAMASAPSIASSTQTTINDKETTVGMVLVGCSEKRGVLSTSTAAFSEIASKFVAVDTLVHKATSYTEQLARSGAGHSKRESQVKWEIDNNPEITSSTAE